MRIGQRNEEKSLVLDHAAVDPRKMIRAIEMWRIAYHWRSFPNDEHPFA